MTVTVHSLGAVDAPAAMVVVRDRARQGHCEGAIRRR